MTKRFLFIPTAKESVQRIAWQSSLGDMTGVEPTKQGLLKKQDHLEITCRGGAVMHFHIFGQDSLEWRNMIAAVALVPYRGFATITVPAH